MVKGTFGKNQKISKYYENDCRRCCKIFLDCKENTNYHKRLLLVKIDSGSNQSVVRSFSFALLLVMCPDNTIGILKLCRLESRLQIPSEVLKLGTNKIRFNGHPILLHAINK